MLSSSLRELPVPVHSEICCCLFNTKRPPSFGGYPNPWAREDGTLNICKTLQTWDRCLTWDSHSLFVQTQFLASCLFSPPGTFWGSHQSTCLRCWQKRGLCKQEIWSVYEKHGRSGIQHFLFVHPRKNEKTVKSCLLVLALVIGDWN